MGQLTIISFMYANNAIQPGAIAILQRNTRPKGWKRYKNTERETREDYPSDFHLQAAEQGFQAKGFVKGGCAGASSALDLSASYCQSQTSESILRASFSMTREDENLQVNFDLPIAVTPAIFPFEQTILLQFHC